MSKEVMYFGMIPTTSLQQIYSVIGNKLDPHIIYIKGAPRRHRTEEVDEPKDLPYCKFRKMTTIQLELLYDYSKVKVPFDSDHVISAMTKHGIDDCFIQRMKLFFNLSKEKTTYLLTFNTRSVSGEIGRFVMQKRAEYLAKIGRKPALPRKSKKTGRYFLPKGRALMIPNQLELIEVRRNGYPVPAIEFHNIDFLSKMQKLTYGVMLIKQAMPTEKKQYVDLALLDGRLRGIW